MRSSIAIVSLAAVATAEINYGVVASVHRRDNLVARATDLGGCVSEASAIYKSLPTPPPDIAKAIGGQSANADPCDFKVPQSLSKEFSSYSKELISWAEDHKSEILSFYSDCSALASNAPLHTTCASGTGAIETGTGTGAAAPSETGTGSGSKATDTAAPKTTGASETTKPTKTGDKASSSGDSKPTSSSGKNGAARETGMAFAAVVAAGFAVAAL